MYHGFCNTLLSSTKYSTGEITDFKKQLLTNKSYYIPAKIVQTFNQWKDWKAYYYSVSFGKQGFQCQIFFAWHKNS